jgi:hypothetical protein
MEINMEMDINILESFVDFLNREFLKEYDSTDKEDTYLNFMTTSFMNYFSIRWRIDGSFGTRWDEDSNELLKLGPMFPEKEPQNLKLKYFLITYFPELTESEVEAIYNDAYLTTETETENECYGLNEFYGSFEEFSCKHFNFYNIYNNLINTQYFQESAEKKQPTELIKEYLPIMLNITIDDYEKVKLFHKLNDKTITKSNVLKAMCNLRLEKHFLEENYNNDKRSKL